MMKDKSAGEIAPPLANNPGDRPHLSEAAQRALAEAEARRAAASSGAADNAAEVGGRGGLDPARYGDWEVKGVASDF